MSGKWVTYQPGELCERCGIDRTDKPYGPCSLGYGAFFKRHLWNTKPLRVKVYEIPQSKVGGQQ